jgi:hypothetical protein
LNAVGERVGLQVDQGLFGLEQPEAAVDGVELRSEAGRHTHLVQSYRVAQSRYDTRLLHQVVVRRVDTGQGIGRIAHRAQHGDAVVVHGEVELGRGAAVLRSEPAALEYRNVDGSTCTVRDRVPS